jgi:hypothetical protein
MCLLKFGCDGCMMARDLPKFLQDAIMAQTIQPSEQTADAASSAQVAQASIYELGPPSVSVLQLPTSSKQAKWSDDIGRHVRNRRALRGPKEWRIFRSRRSAWSSFGSQPPGLRLRHRPQPYQNMPTTLPLCGRHISSEETARSACSTLITTSPSLSLSATQPPAAMRE